LSARTALQNPSEIEKSIQKLKNLMAQLEKVVDQTNCRRRASTMSCANLVGMTTQRRKLNRNGSHLLPCCRQPPRSTTIGYVTSRTATGARTVLQDVRLENAEALKPWDGSQAAT